MQSVKAYHLHLHFSLWAFKIFNLESLCPLLTTEVFTMYLWYILENLLFIIEEILRRSVLKLG